MTLTSGEIPEASEGHCVWSLPTLSLFTIKERIQQVTRGSLQVPLQVPLCLFLLLSILIVSTAKQMSVILAKEDANERGSPITS